MLAATRPYVARSLLSVETGHGRRRRFCNRVRVGAIRICNPAYRLMPVSQLKMTLIDRGSAFS
jgi:hypothetical protein